MLPRPRSEQPRDRDTPRRIEILSVRHARYREIAGPRAARNVIGNDLIIGIELSEPSQNGEISLLRFEGVHHAGIVLLISAGFHQAE